MLQVCIIVLTRGGQELMQNSTFSDDFSDKCLGCYWNPNSQRRQRFAWPTQIFRLRAFLWSRQSRLQPAPPIQSRCFQITFRGHYSPPYQGYSTRRDRAASPEARCRHCSFLYGRRAKLPRPSREDVQRLWCRSIRHFHDKRLGPKPRDVG